MEIYLDPMPLESLRSSRRYATAALRSLYVTMLVPMESHYLIFY